MDKQGDAAASAGQDALSPLPEGTGTVAPGPAVVTRSQTRTASESRHKLLGSPKKIAVSRKVAGGRCADPCRDSSRESKLS